MFRRASVILSLALWSGAAGVVRAQMAPPPEGPPQANNPYAAPAAPSSAANPAMLAKAKVWFAALQSGSVDRSKLGTGPNSNLTEATIENAQKMIGGLGKPVSFVAQQTQTKGGVTATIYLVTFRDGRKVDFLFAVDGQGKVDGLALGTPER